MSLDQHTASILAVIVISINFGIYLPVGAYCSLKFWRLRHDTLIAKRRPALVLASIVAIYIWMLAARTQYVLDTLLGSTASPYLSLLLVDVGWLCVNTVLLRMWLLWFDYQRATHLSAMRWRSQLNAAQLPWTVQLKRLANVRCLLALALSHWTLMELIAVLSPSVSCRCR